MASQPDLFGTPLPARPEGFAYAADAVTLVEEAALVAEIERLPFRRFQFHGHEGNRRTVSFGRRYDFGDRRLHEAGEIPAWLTPLRDRAAAFAGVSPDAFAHALVTEYAPGAGIGWHRDRPEFGVVAGVSLLTACPFRFRRRTGESWERMTVRAEPRSIYRLDGPARTEWEHSIPPLEALRYSVTFRTLRRERGSRDG